MSSESEGIIQRSSLPTGWRISRIGELLKVRNGFAFKSTDYQEEGALLIRQSNLDRSRVSLDKAKYLPLLYLEEYHDFLVRKGDILIGMSGSIGKLCTYDLDEPALQNQRTGLLVFKDPEQQRWVWHYLPLLEKELLKAGKGVAVQNVSAKQIESFPIPIAPIDQQKLIVAEIEKQFSRLDEAVANLKRIKANLKRYKAAVLKAAVEGKLTKEWRKQNPDVEPADKLLERILTKRRQKWEEAELVKMKAKGKTPKDDKWKQKYKEPTSSAMNERYKYPEDWVGASMDQLTMFMENGFGKRSQVQGDLKVVLRLADVIEGEITYSSVRRINCIEDQIQKYALAVNDLLILRVNGSPDLVGRFVLLKEIPETTLFCDHFIRARCVFPVFASWLRLCADTKGFRRFVDLNKVSSAGQNTINQKTLSGFVFPLPSMEEQRVIVSEVDRRLSIIDQIETQVEIDMERSGRMRQAILASVYSGELPYKLFAAPEVSVALEQQTEMV